MRGQLANCRKGIDVADRDAQIGAAAQECDHLRREQGMSPEVEKEILFDADCGDAKNGRPCIGDFRFERIYRRCADIRFVDQRSHRSRQALAVNLACREHRQVVEHVEIARDHVYW